MPKVKTHRGVAKRFKPTATGRFKRSNANLGHLLSKKSSDRKRRLKANDYVSDADSKRISKLLPNI